MRRLGGNQRVKRTGRDEKDSALERCKFEIGASRGVLGDMIYARRMDTNLSADGMDIEPQFAHGAHLF